MRKRKVFQECLLSAAVVVLPGMSLAGDATPLTPVSTGVSLQKVPDAETVPRRIQLIQYKPSTHAETVDSELQHLFSEAQPSATVVQSRFVTQEANSELTLVRHRSRNPETPGAKKKNGFFKRLFGKLSGNDDSENGDAAVDENGNPLNGEPAPAIPTPPPIDYSVRKTTQISSSSAGVPAVPAGFHQGSSQQGPANTASTNSGAAQPFLPLVPQYQPTITDGPAPFTGRPVAQGDEFVSPFVNENAGSQEDTILDLDSLVQGSPTTPSGAQKTLNAPQAEPEGLVVDGPLPEVQQSEKVPEPQQTANDGTDEPFTGYRLPSDDQVLGLPEPQPAPERQSQPESAQDQVISDAGQLVNEKTSAPVTHAPAPTGTVVRIPLLEEPSRTPRPATDEAPAVEQLPVTAVAVDEGSKGLPPKTVEVPSANALSVQTLSDRARREQQRYRIMARTGKTGFKGFCPVELRDSRDLVDSREQYKAKFGLQVYYFSSPEAKTAFESNPSRYAPAGGGSDVVLLVNTGEETPGSLDFSLWYRDRLYMFRSRETQAMFSEDPRRYADQY